MIKAAWQCIQFPFLRYLLQKFLLLQCLQFFIMMICSNTKLLQTAFANFRHFYIFHLFIFDKFLFLDPHLYYFGCYLLKFWEGYNYFCIHKFAKHFITLISLNHFRKKMENIFVQYNIHKSIFSAKFPQLVYFKILIKNFVYFR